MYQNHGTNITTNTNNIWSTFFGHMNNGHKIKFHLTPFMLNLIIINHRLMICYCIFCLFMLLFCVCVLLNMFWVAVVDKHFIYSRHIFSGFGDSKCFISKKCVSNEGNEMLQKQPMYELYSDHKYIPDSLWSE